MNFLMSDDQLALLDAVRSLLHDACDPRRVHEIFDGDGFDTSLWSSLCEMGVPSILVPEAAGGLGLRLIDLAIVAELLGAFAAPVPFFGHAVATLAMQMCGSEEQRARWLPRLASGEMLATIALGEGEGRWTPDEWRLAPQGDTLSGVKMLVPHAAEADLIVVGTQPGFVLVEKGMGFRAERLDTADRTRPVDTVTFDMAPVAILPGDAEAIARVMDGAAVLLAADAFGGAYRCVEMSVDYGKMREQYGQPIGGFQGLKHQLANMALAVEPARGLYWFAAHAWDAIPRKARHAAAQAKAHVTDIYLQTARDTVEAHGGIGFTWEHDAHIYLKRAMFDWTWLGQPDRHRARAADLEGW